MNDLYKQTILPALGLFTSVGTLLCCALPALFVTLGMGAALAGFIGAAPWITALSDFKEMIFIGAGGILAVAALMQWRGRHAPCPADPAKAKICMRLRKLSLIILSFAIIIYLIGFFFAFLAAEVFF